ncbi:MAG: acyl dehydratase MaoC [Parcubacteria group bacterium Gr01-1014_56]|nr:MAG: acyl dehydratase MaoC [Parcubacteria group bacterium Gr01-1014_56]
MGECTQFEVVVTEELVDAFAKLSDDFNPLHMDEVYAKKTAFKGRVVHGMLGGAFFSRLIGMHLPGARSLYLSQSLSFRKPMRIGMEVIVSGTVLHKADSLQTITLLMQVSDKGSGEVLTDGEAIVKML